MEISVVVPSYNAGQKIGRCVEALLQQDFPRANYEIIVVDDGSTDGTVDSLSRYPINVVRQKHMGPAAARNLGARASKGKIIAFTDADCAPKKNWLSTLLSNFADPSVGGVGGSYETGNRESVLARTIGYEIADKHDNMPSSVDFIGSFNCAYRRDAFEKAGGFDVSFQIASGEDNDLSYRIFSMGYRLLFDRRAVVVHDHPTKVLNYLSKQLKHAMWRVMLYKKHPNRIRGDVYAGLSPRVQLALYGFLLLGLILSLFFSWVLFASAALLMILFLSNLPIALRIYGKSRDFRCFFLALSIFFLRGFAWMIGVAAGVIRFLAKRSN